LFHPSSIPSRPHRPYDNHTAYVDTSLCHYLTYTHVKLDIYLFTHPEALTTTTTTSSSFAQWPPDAAALPVPMKVTRPCALRPERKAPGTDPGPSRV
jgi:hypothetical protein